MVRHIRKFRHSFCFIKSTSINQLSIIIPKHYILCIINIICKRTFHHFPFTVNQLLTLSQICRCTRVTQCRQYHILQYIPVLNSSIYFVLYEHLTCSFINHSLVRTKPLNKTAYREWLECSNVNCKIWVNLCTCTSLFSTCEIIECFTRCNIFYCGSCNVIAYMIELFKIILAITINYFIKFVY